MRKFFNPLSFIAFLCLLTGMQCRKDKDKPSSVLPPVTQEGKNTIGFKVNGEVWVPYCECSYLGNPCGEISANYGPPDTDIQHFAFQVTRHFSGHGSSLTIISLTPITTLGNKYDSIHIEYRTGNGVNLGRSYTKSLFNTPGNFEINRIDSVNRIIAGVFSFRLYNTVNGVTDSIEITGGRFDFKVKTCTCR